MNSYTVIFASFLLSGGKLADRYGAHRTFRLGLVIFTGASLFCGLAPNITVLITTRVLQGPRAALMVPASLSLIAHLYTASQNRAKAVAIWVGIGSTAVACGPILGGLLIELFCWRGVFLVNPPFGIFSLALAFLSIPVVSQRQESSLDVPGQLLAIFACCALTFGLI